MISESQVSDGYICSCGETFAGNREFKGHYLTAGRDGSEHRSRGRVNMETGEITMPPWNERTAEQKKESRYAKKKDRPSSSTVSATSSRQTEVLAQAVELKFVPRIYTIDYSPVIRMAQDASRAVWGWPELPLGDFLDTIIYRYFSRCGVILAGFIVDETKGEQEAREKSIAEFKKQEEVSHGSQA